MNKILRQLIILLFCVLSGAFFSCKIRAATAFTHIHSHRVHVLHELEGDSASYTWHEEAKIPFNELIFSWNAVRPRSGRYEFSIRIKAIDRWSCWIKYAEWGAFSQRSFSYCNDKIAQLNVDTLTVKKGLLATAFEVKIKAIEGALLDDVHFLYASVSNLDKYKIIKASGKLKSGFIDRVPQRSQMVIKHARANDMCSPTSTSTALSYFLQKNYVDLFYRGCLDPLDFAALAYDSGNDIYGNWVLNVAAAYDVAGGKLACRVQRLANFNELHSCLINDCPVVVSVKGPLRGGATPYKNGHLMVVIGWDAAKKRVLCIDSAFKTDKKTKVWYDGDDFLKAWGRRKNLSYVFVPLSLKFKEEHLKLDAKNTIFSFFGAPGSGKGTLAGDCVKFLGFKVLSTGNLCRECIARGDDFGRTIENYIKSGQLIPDETITNMVEEWIKKELVDGSKIILDGYPRTKKQAELFLDLIKQKLPHCSLRIVSMVIPEDEIVKRLSDRLVCENKQCQATTSKSIVGDVENSVCSLCGSKLIRRKDDSEEVVRERLRVYAKHSGDLLRYYQNQGQKIDELNASGLTIKQVFENFKKTCFIS